MSTALTSDQSTPPGYPYHVDTYGNLLAVSMPDHHKVQVFDKNGTLITTMGGSAGHRRVNFLITMESRLIIQEKFMFLQDNHRIQYFEQNGTYLGKIGNYGNSNGTV